MLINEVDNNHHKFQCNGTIRKYQAEVIYVNHSSGVIFNLNLKLDQGRL
jgi:hypothetical protein